MLQFLKRLFCIHDYDYESDIFVQIECRNCGKVKKQPSPQLQWHLPNVLRHINPAQYALLAGFFFYW